MKSSMIAAGAIAVLCVSTLARADDSSTNSESVGRLRAAVADVRDSFAQIRQVVAIARDTRNPNALNCAWNLQEKTADLLHAGLAALHDARSGQTSDDKVMQVLSASREVSNLEASAHLCLTTSDAVRAPPGRERLPSTALAELNGREVLFRDVPDSVRGFVATATP